MGFGRDVPMTAIFLNAYVPPQPSPLRCHAFGQALARAMARMGRRAVLIASGGLSHYPGTRHYPHPDVATDQVLHEQLSAGNLAHRSEEHTSELQSLMRISYAVFCLK